jgi:hypothetical protein
MLHHSVYEPQDGQRFELPASSFVIVFEEKADASSLKANDSTFRDHRPFCVSAGVPNRSIGTLKGWSDQDMPTFLAHMSKEQINVDLPRGVTAQRTTMQGRFCVFITNPLYEIELPFHREQRNGNQVPLRRIYPSRLIGSETTRGDHDMEMDVPLQVTAKRMHHGDDTGTILGNSTTSLTPFLPTTTQRFGLPKCQAQDRSRKSMEAGVNQPLAIVLNGQPKFPWQRKH